MKADKARSGMLGLVLVLLVAGIVSAAVVAERSLGGDGGGDQVAGAASATPEAYAPDEVVVDPGGDVVFRNGDREVHTFTAVDGLFDSGPVEPGATFRWAAGSPRVVTYRCELHPAERGTIIVGGGR